MKKILFFSIYFLSNLYSSNIILNFTPWNFFLQKITDLKSEFKDLNDLITENRKDAHFTVSFWQNKNNSPTEETSNQKENKVENVSVDDATNFLKKYAKKKK